MELKQEIIEDKKQLNEEQRKKFAQKVASNFHEWDKDRQEQINVARTIMEAVYLMQSPKKYDGDLEWKSDVRLNGLYNIKRTIKAQLWKEMWADPQQMFDVKGTNKDTEEQSKAQKAALVDSLNKMNVGVQFDKAMDDLLDVGTCIFKTDWERRTKIVKRQKKGVGFVLQKLMRNMSGAGYIAPEMVDQAIPTYENARVEAVSPLMFVFDHTSYKLKNAQSWDSCMKIYKRFDSLENIKNNKAYTVTDEQLEDLKHGTENDNNDEENKELIDLREQTSYGNQYSILYAHGDFKIDGVVYKNYIAEVLADKYLIRFEENPVYINPFIMCAIEYNPRTKYGISILQPLINMTDELEKLTNVAFDVQKLTANPSYWVNESMLNENNTNKDGSIVLAPGKMFELEESYSGGMPVPIEVSANGISDLISLLSQKIADVSSTSNVTFGNIESKDRTATELSLADKGASSQYSKILDIVYQDLTIPMVRNVAELLAMFKDGAEYVYMQEKGKDIEFEINNAIRQAQYNYVYEDRNAIIDRKSKFKEMFELFNSVGQNEELFKMIDWHEVLTSAVEMIGYDNSDKFFVDQTPEQQAFEEFKGLPDEVKQQVLPVFQQVTQQTMQQFQQQQQDQQLQQQAMEQVQRQQYRDNARMQLEQGQMAQGIM